MNVNPSSFGGAYDLSALANRARQAAGNAPGDKAQEPPSSSSQGGSEGAVQVASYVLEINPASLASFVKLSERVPVMVEFHTVRSQGSQELGRKLSSEVIKREGDVLLVRIDGDNSQVGQLLQAFQVQSLPAVCVLLMGQPIQLFSGDQESDVIKQVIDRVILLARENGVSERAVLSADAAPAAEPALPPRHQAAYDAIETGDYAKAVAEFQAALNESPADVVADSGLAQAKLLLRTDGLELDKVLAKPAEQLSDVIQKADVLAVIGHFDKAFDAILTAFEVADKEDRDKLRTHLIELFKVAGNDNPAVPAARIRLTNLLY